MAALRNLFGKDFPVDKLPAELKPLVNQMRHERTAYEALVQRAEQVAGAVGPLQDQLAQLEQRLAGFDKLAAQLGEFQQSATALEESQRETRASIVETQELARSLRSDLEGFGNRLAEVLAAKAELPGLLELVKPLGALRSEAGALEQHLRALSGQFEQVRGQHQQIESQGAAALAQLRAVEEGLTAAGTRVEGFAARADGLEGAVEQLQQLLKEVPDVKRELSTLNVLAEYVTRKVTAVESQKEMVERATQRAERLTELTAQVDRQLQGQHENTMFLDQLEKNVEAIKRLHEAAMQRADEIEKKHKAIDLEERKLAEAFASQRDALQQAAGNFKFDRDGLEALSQRVAELRTVVSAVEREIPVLDETRGGLATAAADVRQLGGAVQALARQIAELEVTAGTAQAVQGRVRELQDSVAELAHRLEALAPAQLSQELDERARQMEEVRSRLARLETQRAEWDALEERTERALKLAHERYQTVETLKTDLQRLFEVADATVMQVRTVVDLQQQIEQRQQTLGPVLDQLRDLDRQSEALGERQKQFTEAEERLARLDALLIDLQSTFQTVLDQKEFLERVVETAGNLALQTMQAEAAIATLREAGERAKGKRAQA